MKVFRRRRKLFTIIVLLVVLRLVANPLILKELNNYLADFSPLYSVHIDDLGISLFAVSYDLNGVKFRMKKNQRVFFSANSIQISLAWRELLHLRVLADVDLQSAKIDLDKSMAVFAKQNAEQSKNDAKKVKNALVPVNVAELDINDSSLSFNELNSVNPHEAWTLSHCKARATNLTPDKSHPTTSVFALGDLLKSAKLKINARVKSEEKDSNWIADLELARFDITKANPIFLKTVPISFVSGTLDLYAEVKSEHGKLNGYVRPFAQNIHILGDKADFKGPKHFFVEILAAFAAWILKSPKDESIATQIDFHSENKQIKVDEAKALGLALNHGFGGKKVKPRVDHPLPIPMSTKAAR